MLTPKTRTLEILRGRYDPGTDTGYMGYVSASDLITGIDLANQLNFNKGEQQHSSAGWLKFYVGPTAKCNYTGKHKVLYIAKKSFKHDVSWDDINEVGLVDGMTCITIKEKLYSVRLMTGGDYFPGYDSEWNELMCRVHREEEPDSMFNWATFDPDLETNIASGNGRYVWCQEAPLNEPSHRVLRGGSLRYWNDDDSYYPCFIAGWRPVLELVE